MILDATLSATRLARSHREIVSALGTGPIDAPFDAARLEPSALDGARRCWRARMVAEHRSVPVFLLLAAQLFEAEAPLDAQTVMARLAQDELRHTELCATMLRALCDEPRLHTDATAAPLATHAGCSLAERALRNVVYACCLSEMVADTLERTSAPLARQITRSILADEVMHGQFGFLYLEAVRPDEPTRASLADYLTHAFAVLEREMVRPAAEASPEAQALGVCDGPRGHEIFYGTIESAVVPGLEALGIDAARAWRRRRLAGQGGLTGKILATIRREARSGVAASRRGRLPSACPPGPPAGAPWICGRAPRATPSEMWRSPTTPQRLSDPRRTPEPPDTHPTAGAFGGRWRQPLRRAASGRAPPETRWDRTCASPCAPGA